MKVNKSQLLLYINFSFIVVILFFQNWHFALPFLMLFAFFPILNKNRFTIIEYIFMISLMLVFIRFLLLNYFDFSYVYIKFFPLDSDIMNYSVVLSLVFMVFFSYILFIFNNSIKKEIISFKSIDTSRTNKILSIMLIVKLIIFYYASIKMGSSTSFFQRIIDMIIANLFLVDLLFLISFLYKNISKLNLILFVLISVITTSKAAIFILFLLYITANSNKIKYHKIFNLKYLLYLILGIVFFIIAGTLSYAARTSGDLNFIFLSIDPVLGLFRRLGMIDNIIVINTIDYQHIEYFTFPNLILQFILGFVLNSLFDFGYYGVSIGWALAHYGLGQPDDVINAYETSLIGTSILFSHGSIILAFINMMLISAPILGFYYFSKDPVVKYYALFMYIILFLTGDIRVDALFLKHLIVYKFIILPIISTKKEDLFANSIHNRA